MCSLSKLKNNNMSLMKIYNEKFILLLAAISLFIMLLNPLIGNTQTDINRENTLKSANQYFIDKAYRHALQLFLSLEKTNSEDAILNYKIGICYLYTVDKSKSLAYLERAIQLGKGTIEFTDMDYYLGRYFHLSHQFQEAISHYKLYKKQLDTLDAAEYLEMKTVEHYITNCQHGIQLADYSDHVNIEHLPLTINSGFTDFLPVISRDGKSLFFASRRHTSIGGTYDPSTYEYNEDIYISKKENDKWMAATHFGDIINETCHEAPLSISADGKKIFFYKSDKGHGYDIYKSDFSDSKWLSPSSLDLNINSEDHETGFCLSPDGKKIYFASDRPGGYGGVDIYYSEVRLNGSYSTPVNLGPAINSTYDENFPFISWDGKKLFFSSDGHNSIGGFDLFSSNFDQRRHQWTKAKNLGFPINTADDELSISFPEDESYALYSARHEDSYGDEDIYMIKFEEDFSHLLQYITRLPSDEHTPGK
jgi:tetratricopeptide (TPR) repeat protein